MIAVAARAALTVILSASLHSEVSVTDADLLPGHLTTVWWDEACGCRRVVVEERAATETESHDRVTAPVPHTAEAPTPGACGAIPSGSPLPFGGGVATRGHGGSHG